MSAWANVPNGCSATLFNTRVDILRVNNASPSVYKITIEGVESSTLPNGGMVNNLAEGRNVAFDFLNKLNKRDQPSNSSWSKQTGFNSLKAKALELAITAVSSSLPPVEDDSPEALLSRLKMMIKAAESFQKFIENPAQQSNTNSTQKTKSE